MSPDPLDRPLTSIGPFVRRYARDLAALGISTVRDALFHFPFRYEDLSNVLPIAAVRGGETASVKAVVKSVNSFRSPRKGIQIVEAIVSDGTGNAVLTWFGQKYLAKTLVAGEEIMISGLAAVGRGPLKFVSPAWEPVRDAQAHVGRIVPVYPVGGELTARAMRAIMLRLKDEAAGLMETIPSEIVLRHDLMPRAATVSELHFPSSMKRLREAERTRDFEQLFMLALGSAWIKADFARYRAAPVPFSEGQTVRFVKSLPFALTDGQRKSAWEILKDLGRETPMNRLLDGDVGSGKTLVAAIAAMNVALAGGQSVFLVPTAVLANQHFSTLARYLSTAGVDIALVTAATVSRASGGETERASRPDVIAGIAAGKTAIVVGTHALLEDDVAFRDLRLAVVDEQHRFGVAHRKKLSSKAGEGFMPHLLSMTATPIPRTLALTAFGDLDISSIPELPKGRRPVETKVLTCAKGEVLHAALRRTVAAGHQAFAVCPRISDEGESDRRSVAEVAAELRQALPELRIAELHGKMKPRDKDAVMEAFMKKGQDVLVSTTVIEVGVDVPNATLMAVDGAESFGLAQLHQLRGRVGRGEAPGECLLIPRGASRESYARLKLLERCHDGWKLAEADLETRGPGEILGTAQSGFVDISLSALRNGALREAAKQEAETLVAADSSLASHPVLREQVLRRFGDVQMS